MNSDQIIQQILQQTLLSEVEIYEWLSSLKKSLHYDPQATKEGDSIIPRLLAQELNVDLGDPSNYLYTELLFDEDPFCVRILPFVTIDKTKIKNTFHRLLEDIKSKIPYSYVGYGMIQELTAPDLLNYLFGEHGGTFVINGILFHFRTHIHYSEFDFNDFSGISSIFNEIIDQARFFRTFTDYPIVRTADPERTFLPYSLLKHFFINPPGWASFHNENHDSHLKFPYITLNSLQTAPDTLDLRFYNSRTIEIIDTEVLQYCPDIKSIEVWDEDNEQKRIHFPSNLQLPNLEYLSLDNIFSNINLSFLQYSPNLRILRLSGCFKIIDLSPLEHCPMLESFKITGDFKTIDLSPLKHCSRLESLDISGFHLKSIDLSPLKQCSSLQHLRIWPTRLIGL